MSFVKGQSVIYTDLNRNQFEGKVIERKADFKEGYIDTFNAKGNFDYLVDINIKGTIKRIFCSEGDLH